MSAHLDTDELAARLGALPAPPRDEGVVVLVVVRPETDARETPAVVRLTPERGVEGDRWSKKERTVADTQVTLMRADVARLFANGQPLSLFGDNLIVELDLSAQNLPPGARLRVGTAACEITAKPHTGCAKFEARFGAGARALTLDERFASLKLRGIHARVLEAGEVRPGDRIRVLAR